MMSIIMSPLLQHYPFFSLIVSILTSLKKEINLVNAVLIILLVGIIYILCLFIKKKN